MWVVVGVWCVLCVVCTVKSSQALSPLVLGTCVEFLFRAKSTIELVGGQRAAGSGGLRVVGCGGLRWVVGWVSLGGETPYEMKLGSGIYNPNIYIRIYILYMYRYIFLGRVMNWAASHITISSSPE